MGDLTLFTPEAVLILGGLLTFALTAFDAGPKMTWIVAVIASLGAVVAAAWFLDATGEPFFAGIYRVDAFSQVLKLGIAVGLAFTVALCSPKDMGSLRSNARGDVPFFLFISSLGMMMLVSATELLTVYVALELSAYGLYILAALHTNRTAGGEAGTKYLLFGAASSAVSLYGISLIYGIGGSTYLADLVAIPMSPLLVVSILLALSGLLFKLAVFPFHAWAPDTYEGAPHQAATFIGTASKVAAVGVILRVLMLATDPGGHPTDAEAPIRAGVLFDALLWLSVASMTFGNLAALAQRDLKRLLAYSTIAQAGYMMMGIAAMSHLGAASAIFYGLTYVPMVLLPFIVVIALGRDGSNPTFTDLRGLHQRSGLLALTLLVGMFALAGIPPTAGFAGKWFLFSAAMERNLFWLVIVAALNATISLYYYLQVVRAAFIGDADEDAEPFELSSSLQTVAWIAIALTVGFGIFPAPIWELATAAATALFGG